MGANSAHDGHGGGLGEGWDNSGRVWRAQTCVCFLPETLLFISDHGCMANNFFCQNSHVAVFGVSESEQPRGLLFAPR